MKTLMPWVLVLSFGCQGEADGAGVVDNGATGDAAGGSAGTSGGTATGGTGNAGGAAATAGTGGGAFERGTCVEGQLWEVSVPGASACPCEPAQCGVYEGDQVKVCECPEGSDPAVPLSRSECRGEGLGYGPCVECVGTEGLTCAPPRCEGCGDCCSACLCTQGYDQNACLDACGLRCQLPPVGWAPRDSCIDANERAGLTCAACGCDSCSKELLACQGEDCRAIVACASKNGCALRGTCAQDCAAVVAQFPDQYGCALRYAELTLRCLNDQCQCTW